MAKHTTRDQIWHAALTIAESGSRFRASHVMAKIDDADPSDRTVRDCLKTMVEYGYLDGEDADHRIGEYWSPDLDRAPGSYYGGMLSTG